MPIRRHLTIGLMLVSLIGASLSSQLLAMQQTGRFAELHETSETTEAEVSAQETGIDAVDFAERERMLDGPRARRVGRTSDVRRCLIEVSAVPTPPPEQA